MGDGGEGGGDDVARAESTSMSSSVLASSVLTMKTSMMSIPMAKKMQFPIIMRLLLLPKELPQGPFARATSVCSTTPVSASWPRSQPGSSPASSDP